MSSTSKIVLAAALLFGAAAGAHEGYPDSGTNAVEGAAEPDRISKIAAKFKGTIFLFDQSLSPDTFDAQAQLSPIPSYQWWLSFRPRYYITPKLSLRVRMDLTIEWLNAVDTTEAREAQFGDLWTDLAYNPPTFWKVVPTVALRAVWGTSKTSIGETQIAKVGPSVGLVREFNLGRAGTYEFALSVYGLYHFDQYTTAGVQGKLDMAATRLTGLPACYRRTPASQMNPQGSLTTLISGKYSPVPKFSINVTYAILDAWAYHLPPATLPEGAQLQPAYDTRFSQQGWFLASVDYEVKDWLELSLGYYCLRNIRDPNSKIGDPFWEPGGTTRIFLTTTFNLDKVYESAARRSQRAKAKSQDLAFRF